MLCYGGWVFLYCHNSGKVINYFDENLYVWYFPIQSQITLMEILIDFQRDFIFAPKLLVLPAADSLKCWFYSQICEFLANYFCNYFQPIIFIRFDGIFLIFNFSSSRICICILATVKLFVTEFLKIARRIFSIFLRFSFIWSTTPVLRYGCWVSLFWL